MGRKPAGRVRLLPAGLGLIFGFLVFAIWHRLFFWKDKASQSCHCFGFIDFQKTLSSKSLMNFSAAFKGKYLEFIKAFDRVYY